MRCDRRDALLVRFEVAKIVKSAGRNFNQLDLILGKNLARLIRIEPKPSVRKTMDITYLTMKSFDAYRRLLPRN
jgi:hypothetical protein